MRPMKRIVLAAVGSAVLILASVGVVRTEAREELSRRTARVTCDEEGSVVSVRSGSGPLQRAIDASRPGASILVSGTCHENVTVPVGKDSIMLDGRGTAAIVGPDSTRPTILVNGRHVTIRGFTITGGQFGIHVREGGSGHIDGNSISDAAVYGIAVSVVSAAVIVNNTIRNNGQAGIGLAENANAFIGFVTTADVDASPNLITGNGTQGIVVFRNSYARIVGNDIRQNTGNGIVVREDSHALITDNAVNANGQNGILVTQGSGVILGAGPGAPNSIFTRPNTTTIANGVFGVRCQLSGFTDGSLGSLKGTSGAESYAEGCIPSLVP